MIAIRAKTSLFELPEFADSRRAELGLDQHGEMAQCETYIRIIVSQRSLQAAELR